MFVHIPEAFHILRILELFSAEVLDANQEEEIDDQEGESTES